MTGPGTGTGPGQPARGPAADPGGAGAPSPDLSVRLRAPAGEVTLAPGVLTASGCAAAGRELAPFLDLRAIGAVVTKTVLSGARSGRGTPRMAETPGGMLNSIGLQGAGVDALATGDLPWLAQHGARAVVSIAGGDVDEFAAVAARLRAGVAALPPPAREVLAAVEVNISCPNVANRGLVFACDAGASRDVVQAVRAATDPAVPVLAKLSPDVTDVVAIAGATLDAGADGLTMINTVLGAAMDVDRLRPVLPNVTGGLSGPAIRPVAVRCVWQVRAAMRAGLLPAAPIVGVGGVATGRDAAELVVAGADAVQVGTATFADPTAPARVAAELAEWVRGTGRRRLADLVGVGHGGDR